MGRFVNPDGGAFQAMLSSKIYVDKSGLLEYTNQVLGSMDAYICSSRPRRFGKSTTANMLTAYYSRGCDSGEMFSDLEIGSSPDFREHLNKYDVIHMDIQWCLEPAGGPDKLVDYLTEHVLSELRGYYSRELPVGIQSLPEALSVINNATGRKFVVIIDEWDVLIRDAAADKKAVERYISFLRAMFKGTEPTKYILLAYLTGILPIKKETTQSSLNNFDEFTMLNPGQLAPFIGFTEEEVQTLSKRYGRNFPEVKRWYDGYILRDIQVYNPRAVVKVMQNGSFQSYWSETASFETIAPLIGMDFDGLRTSIIEMLSGGAVRVETATFTNDAKNIKNRDDVLTYMIHLGYLAYDERLRQAFVPNEELRQVLCRAVESRKWQELLSLQRESEALLEAALDEDEAAVAEGLERIHREYTSVIQHNNENSLSSMLTIAFLSAMAYYFKPIREMPTGRGFADFVYIPKPEYRGSYPALVIELKWNQNAETAVQQILDKKYPSSMEAYAGTILLIGINYDRKSKAHSCRIKVYEKRS